MQRQHIDLRAENPSATVLCLSYVTACRARILSWSCSSCFLAHASWPPNIVKPAIDTPLNSPHFGAALVIDLVNKAGLEGTRYARVGMQSGMYYRTKAHGAIYRLA